VKGKRPDPNLIIGIAFGKPSEPATRKPEDFKRKPLAEIAKGTDQRFEAVRLAPSGMNGQPWYFVVDGGKIHVYYKRSLGGLAGKLYSLTSLDVGIALAHLDVASEHEGKPFNFTVNNGGTPAAPNGFVYVGTVG
jgi:nitroreductase